MSCDLANPTCASWGHEAVPAVAVGTYTEDGRADVQTAYCGDCAVALIACGVFEVQTVLDPLAFANRPCPACGGTGQVPR